MLLKLFNIRVIILMIPVLSSLGFSCTTEAQNQSWQFVFSPGSDLYPRYIADPLRPGIALTRLDMSETEIPEAGDARYLLKIGGRYSLLRFHPTGKPTQGFQFDVEAAFLGQFDIDKFDDNIGWDGLYGFLVTWTNERGLALKLATKHDSSHLGDEYIQDTGRKRLNYTRQELVGGVSIILSPLWRLYGEAGYGWELRNEARQEPWRVKGGGEFEDATQFWDGQGGYYGAIDLTSTEELDWQQDLTIQTGFVFHTNTLARTYRLGVEYREGRSVIGEFFQQNETYLAFGLWADL